MKLKPFCITLQTAVTAQLRAQQSAREDARAFGASLEKRVVEHWADLCRQQGWRAEPLPGRRTIYDIACEMDGLRVGVDVNTTDLDPGRYADGGICSVDNLLRFLAGREADRRGVLVVLELAHQSAPNNPQQRVVKSVTAAPLHTLPLDDFRIENLGTGQVRLNRLVADMQPQWQRTTKDFLEGFVPLVKQHYDRVAADAQRRKAVLEDFERRGCTDFVAPRAAH